MRLPVIEYLRAARAPRDVEFDLSRSGMPEVPPERLGVPANRLFLDEGADWGGPTLRAAIARSFRLPESDVLPAHGTTFAIFLVCAALLERGDRVLVERPAYEPLLSIPRFFDAAVDRFDRPFAEDYRIDRDRLAGAVRPDTRLLILTDPHNPSGRVLSEEDRTWLARFAEERDLNVLLDEVYIDFTGVDGFRQARSLGERMISIGSLTKVYGLGRLRVGWILARPELIARAAPLYDYTLGDPSGPSAALGVAAFGMREVLRETGRRRAEENRRIVAEWMAGRPELEWVEPGAGIVAFPRFRGGVPLEGGDSSAFVKKASARHGVLTVPGAYFEDPRGFRVGFGIETDRLAAALERLGRAVAEAV
ncbi:MAG: pyridoxal phosphate-dependent aminotransferase [Candidatus Eisenbacteria bacterium]|nr:pyridoxal phosphate-dependent aminotransferase [Candidatus Eisenbacteria bacterium]